MLSWLQAGGFLWRRTGRGNGSLRRAARPGGLRHTVNGPVVHGQTPHRPILPEFPRGRTTFKDVVVLRAGLAIDDHEIFCAVPSCAGEVFAVRAERWKCKAAEARAFTSVND